MQVLQIYVASRHGMVQCVKDVFFLHAVQGRSPECVLLEHTATAIMINIAELVAGRKHSAACLRACLRVCVPACLPACLPACRACRACRACQRACVPACLPACLPGWLPACLAGRQAGTGRHTQAEIGAAQTGAAGTGRHRQAHAGTRRHRQAQAGTGRHTQAQAGRQAPPAPPHPPTHAIAQSRAPHQRARTPARQTDRQAGRQAGRRGRQARRHAGARGTQARRPGRKAGRQQAVSPRTHLHGLTTPCWLVAPRVAILTLLLGSTYVCKTTYACVPACMSTSLNGSEIICTRLVYLGMCLPVTMLKL